MYSIHQQEEEEFEAGRFPNELAAAFDYSRRTIEIPKDDTARILELRLEGKFVVVSEGEICCPMTDATLAFVRSIRSIHETEAEAIAACPEDSGDLYIAEPIEAKPVPPVVAPSEDDCPF